MTRLRKGIGTTIIALAAVLVIAIAATGVILFTSQPVIVGGTPATSSSSSTSTTNTTTTSRTSTTNHQNGLPYLSVPKIYADLGYPKITYNGYLPYLPKKPNFTLTYHNSEAYLHIGTVASPVMDLGQAVGLAADYAKMDP
jgi:hypothetical protein